MSRRWSLIAIAAILAATNAFAANGMGMTGSAATMMKGIRTAIRDASGARDDGKGVACLPDGQRFMVSKLVGNERWMVTWDVHMGMGDVSGNVVTDDGIVFLHCRVTGVTGPDPERDSLLMSCDVGDGMVSQTGWGHFDEVSLPGSFFLP